MIPRILVIAGSDSGGGAGIQADIKTVMALGGHATTAITAITAQNTLGVRAVQVLPPEMVIAQIDAVVEDIGVDAVKIGMIGNAAIARAVADRLDPALPRHRDAPSIPVVFDPVMIATSGSVLADSETIEAFETLMSRATLITPNLPELAYLTGHSIKDDTGLMAAAAALAERTGAAVLAKGGHLPGDELTDVLIRGKNKGGVAWSSPRINSRNTHGTGCTLASAVATLLAAGEKLDSAVMRARSFVRHTILAAPGLGAGHGPMGHGFNADLALNQITLPLADYGASVDFYRRLGLRQIVAAAPRYARFEAPNGATLSIEAGGQAGDAVVYLECDDLDARVAALTAQGIVFDEPPRDESWGWREARLRDPAGNRLCLYRAGRNRRFPPWRLPG